MFSGPSALTINSLSPWVGGKTGYYIWSELAWGPDERWLCAIRECDRIVGRTSGVVWLAS